MPTSTQITVDLYARDVRIMRAAREVLDRYTLSEPVRGRDRWSVTVTKPDGATYQVTIDPEWRSAPTCQCPDAANRAQRYNAGYCKHIIAVLLQHEELECQLLDLFLD